MVPGSLVGAVALLVIGASQGPLSYWLGWAIFGVAVAMTLTGAAVPALVQIAGPDARQAVTACTIITGVTSAIFLPLTAWLEGCCGWRMTMLIFSVVFQLAHSVDAVEHPTAEDLDSRPEWVVHQIATTANFATSSRLATFLLGGLNFQREHHLYPRIAHVHYPALARVVREVCDEHGVPCRENVTVMSALRRACPSTTVRSDKPLARAVRT